LSACHYCLKFDGGVGWYIVPCGVTLYGCCPNGVDPALGPNLAGCEAESCVSTQYGCCLDGISTATGPDFDGCSPTIVFNQSEPECIESAYGCCEDGVIAAYGPHLSGCQERVEYGGDALSSSANFSSLITESVCLLSCELWNHLCNVSSMQFMSIKLYETVGFHV